MFTITVIRKVYKTIEAEEFQSSNMLPAFEMIFEKAVYLQILKYVEEKHLICGLQSDFRENHICDT